MTIPHKPFGELSDAEKGALLLAHHEGKRIETRPDCGWMQAVYPMWEPECIYRIAPEPLTPDSIDWSHVAPEFNFMARGPSGCAALLGNEPFIMPDRWRCIASEKIPASSFASYRRGTVDWKDSLVIRPGYEGKP